MYICMLLQLTSAYHFQRTLFFNLQPYNQQFYVSCPAVFGENSTLITTDYIENDNTNNSNIGHACGCFAAV